MLPLPSNHLPPEASQREDCWYGYACWTQHQSEDCARKRNHVRRPTRDSLLSQGLNVVCYLPDELIAKILSCLPVKPLLHFKCVSKPWCSLIENPHFAKMHLKRSIECKTNFGIILRGCSFHSVDFDSLTDATAIEIDDPLKTLLYVAAVVGSCNVLLCLFKTKTDFLLWNPSTRKCQKLHGAPIALPRSLNFQETPLCGFG